MQIRLTFSVIMNHEMLRMRFLFSGSVSGENEVHKMVLFHYTIIFDWNYAKELLTEGYRNLVIDAYDRHEMGYGLCYFRV